MVHKHALMVHDVLYFTRYKENLFASLFWPDGFIALRFCFVLFFFIILFSNHLTMNVLEGYYSGATWTLKWIYMYPVFFFFFFNIIYGFWILNLNRIVYVMVNVLGSSAAELGF